MPLDPTPPARNVDEWMKAVDVGCPTSEESEAVGSPSLPALQSSRDNLHSVVSLPNRRRLAPERIESLKNLKPRLLEFNATAPEASPDLLQVQRIYNLNLVPDVAFEALLAGDTWTFERAVERGGMLNPFQPNTDEAQGYGVQYESVQMQIIKDVLRDPAHPERSLSGKPGDYRILGLFDSTETMRAYLSFRTPPLPQKYADPQAYQTALDEYEQFLRGVLFNDSMHYRRTWNTETTKKHLRSTWEIDTYNVEPGWGGAAAILTRNALQQVQDDFQSLLLAVYCYRFEGVTATDSDTGEDQVFGANKASGDFLTAIGFKEMATRHDTSEFVYRLLSGNKCEQFEPRWLFMHNGPNKIQRYLAAYMRETGLMEEGEELLKKAA